MLSSPRFPPKLGTFWSFFLFAFQAKQLYWRLRPPVIIKNLVKLCAWIGRCDFKWSYDTFRWSIPKLANGIITGALSIYVVLEVSQNHHLYIHIQSIQPTRFLVSTFQNTSLLQHTRNVHMNLRYVKFKFYD